MSGCSRLAGSLHLAAAEPLQLAADQAVVAGEDLFPDPVPHLTGQLGGADDVLNSTVAKIRGGSRLLMGEVSPKWDPGDEHGTHAAFRV